MINKLKTAKTAYDDGYYFRFPEQQVAHITLKVSVGDQALEAGDIRLTKIDPTTLKKIEDNDSLFFRFGFYDYMRLNLDDMVAKYTKDTWYQLDFLFDWEDQKIALYINEKWNATQKFFNDDETISGANAIFLYNLVPETSMKVRELQVCSTTCAGS